MLQPRPGTLSTLAVMAVVAATLSACELRETGSDSGAPTAEEPGGDPAATIADPAATPAATPAAEETPVASIFREEGEEAAAPPPPPPPLELVLAFPDGALLTPQAERLLESALASEAMAQGWPVVLGGHTDSAGNDQANLRASRSRAETVAAWLVERGVADERITVVAFGEQNPIAPNARPDGSANDEGRRTNRRVELRIAPKLAPARPVARPTTAAPARKGA